MVRVVIWGGMGALTKTEFKAYCTRTVGGAVKGFLGCGGKAANACSLGLEKEYILYLGMWSRWGGGEKWGWVERRATTEWRGCVWDSCGGVEGG